VTLSDDPCGTCGGDRRIANSFGLTATCPSCHGSGRKSEDTGFHDVTKTKPSHHRQANKVAAVEKAKWPTTHSGAQLAGQVRDHASTAADVKARLIQEIIAHEDSHGGQCTETFLKKIRKQVRV